MGDVAFSPDRKRLATCCGDRTVYLWDIASGQELARLSVQPGELIKVQFSSDGRKLALIGRVDVKPKEIDHTYADGPRATKCEESVAIVTVWSGSDSE